MQVTNRQVIQTNWLPLKASDWLPYNPDFDNETKIHFASTLCPLANVQRIQLQVEQHRKDELAALLSEKEAQKQQCQELRRELQQQLQYIQQVVMQLNDKEACLEATYVKAVQGVEAYHASTLQLRQIPH